jgi:hypothetical protein
LVLTEVETQELEVFLGQKLPEDSTEYQLRVQSSSQLKSTIELLEALWSTQALKERHFNHWFSELQVFHTEVSVSSATYLYQNNQYSNNHW